MMKIFVPAFIVTASIIANKNQQAYAASCADTFTGSGSVDAGNTLITKLFVNYPSEFVDLNVGIEKHAAQETTITVGGSFVYDKKKYPKLEAAFAISGSEATITVGNDVASSGEMMYSSPALPTMWAASTVAAYGLGNNKATYMSGMMIALATFAPDVLAQTATCSTEGVLLVTIPKRYLFETISAASGANVFNITLAPTSSPTKAPTKSPTKSPTTSPTKSPTTSPTKAPTKSPTKSPTTAAPTNSPTTSTPTQAPVAAGQIFANEYFFGTGAFIELVIPSYLAASDLSARLWRSATNNVATPLSDITNSVTGFSSLSTWKATPTTCGSTIYLFNSSFLNSPGRSYVVFILKNGAILETPVQAVLGGTSLQVTLTNAVSPIPSNITISDQNACDDNSDPNNPNQASCRLRDITSPSLQQIPNKSNYELTPTANINAGSESPGLENPGQHLCPT